MKDKIHYLVLKKTQMALRDGLVGEVLAVHLLGSESESAGPTEKLEVAASIGNPSAGGSGEMGGSLGLASQLVYTKQRAPERDLVSESKQRLGR